LHVLVANHRYILCCIEYTSPWTWFDLTTFRHYWSTICFQFKFQWYPSYNKKRFCLFEVLTLMFHCLFTSILPIYQKWFGFRGKLWIQMHLANARWATRTSSILMNNRLTC
jgi:hypothetical protein